MHPFTTALRSALAAQALALVAAVSLLPAQGRGPKLPAGCEHLLVPAGHAVSHHVFAVGVQVYRWDATASTWAFQGPRARLFADFGGNGLVGVHFAGPAWVSVSGSWVTGGMPVSCPVDPTSIAWLRLDATASGGAGPFAGTTYIQRVHTAGGRAPVRPGAPGEVVEVPYAAEYWFYRSSAKP
jgi:hypothetical protein